MRTAFWLVLALGVLLLLMGFTLAAPLHSDIPTEILKDWYLSHAVLGALAAAVIGVGAGYVLALHTEFIPHEDAGGFHSRVAARGLLLGYLVPLVLVLGLMFVLAARTEEIPLSQGDRILLLFGSGKIVLVLGCTIAAGGLGFAVGTRGRAWGGQFSLLSRKLLPKVR